MFALWSNRDYIHGHETKFRSCDKRRYAVLLVIRHKVYQVITGQ